MTLTSNDAVNDTVTLNDLDAAAQRLAGVAVVTPLIRLPYDTPQSDHDVYAKAENFQKTGSFKLRGAYNFLAALDADVRQRGVVAHSSGNHAQGVACAAHMFGVPATIVIPDNAPPVKVRRTEAWGAVVVRCAARDRVSVAEQIAAENNATLVPPFDHPWIIAGQGTVGLEIAADLPEVANVLVCTGGGGLLAGIATALRERCPQAQIIGVEPELAADAAESFRSGQLTAWDASDTNRTVADGVRTPSLGQLNFEIIRHKVDGFVTVPEEAIRDMTRWYALEARLVIEPTGAMTLAAYRQLLRGEVDGLTLQPGPTVVLVSGGNVETEQLLELLSA